MSTFYVSKENLESYFDAKDLNKDGYLDRNEIRLLLTQIAEKTNGPKINEFSINELLDVIDTNKDNRISKREFVEGFSKHLAARKESAEQSGLSKKDLEAYFNTRDLNKDGYLDRNEVRKLLNELLSRSSCKTVNASESELDNFFKSIDQNGDNKISKDEFIYGFTNSYGNRERPPWIPLNNEMRETLIHVFKKIDTDGSGLISYQEFKKVLLEIGRKHGDYFSDDMIKAQFRYHDINGDGQISIDEFLRVAIV